MTKYLLMFAFIAVVFCNCQKLYVYKKVRLDLSKYDTSLSYDNLKYVSNDTTFELYNNTDSFKEIVNVQGQIITKNSVYDKQTMRLISEHNLFFNCLVGVSNFYNKRGKLIKQIDQDKNYPFSIYKIIEKLQSDYKIDVWAEKQKLSILRSGPRNNRFRYFILYYISRITSRSIIIDGVTGEVLEDRIVHHNP